MGTYIIHQPKEDIMETFPQLLERIQHDYPKLKKVTTKPVWFDWLDGERLPNHTQMMKIIRTITTKPYQIEVWKKHLMDTILPNRVKIPFDDVIVLNVHPMPCPRPRFTKFGKPYMPPKYVLWKKEVIRQLQSQELEKYTTPIRMDVEFWHFSEKKPWGFHTQKPDIDNLQKALLDSFQDAGMIHDDCFVHSINATKIWGYEPKITIKIKRG